MALGILGHADGFADRVPGDDEAQDFFGDLELRRRLLERILLGERGLLFRARPPAARRGLSWPGSRSALALRMDHRNECYDDGNDNGALHRRLLCERDGREYTGISNAGKDLGHLRALSLAIPATAWCRLPHCVRVARRSNHRAHRRTRHLASWRIPEAGHEAYGSQAYRLLPTLVWLSPSDAFLTILCWSGMLASLFLIAGMAPAASAALLWLLYLSLTSAGQVFLQFQWDALLLEAGLLAVVYAPLFAAISPRPRPEPPAVVRWVIWGLVFKLTFLSGITKILSGDATWAQWTALSYHYETQPIPTGRAGSCISCRRRFTTGRRLPCSRIEIGVPWLVFAPVRFRRARLAACALMIGLQLGIAATGNYGFFNLLTIVLCLALLDDRTLEKLPPRHVERGEGAIDSSTASIWRMTVSVVAVGIAALSVLTLFREMDATRGRRGLIAGEWSDGILDWISPFNSINGYGLFRVMTTSRTEIVIEVSEDGSAWKEYEFRWKAGDVMRRPRFVEPHMPRLDWQMWFASTRSARGAELVGSLVGAVARRRRGRHETSWTESSGGPPALCKARVLPISLHVRRRTRDDRRMVEEGVSRVSDG